MVDNNNLAQYPHKVESIKKPEEDGNDHLDQHLQINRLLFSLQAMIGIQYGDGKDRLPITARLEMIHELIENHKTTTAYLKMNSENEQQRIRDTISCLKSLIPEPIVEKPTLHLEQIKKGVTICSEGQLSSSRLISHGIGFEGRKSLTQTYEISVKSNNHVKSYIIDPPSISNGKMDVSITVLGDGIGKAIVEYEVKILSYTID